MPANKARRQPRTNAADTAPRLSTAQFRTLDGIRQATAKALARRWPNEVLPLLITLYAGGLVEVLQSPLSDAFVAMLNAQLGETRWRVTQQPIN